jgi:hypothetical protein
MSSPNRTESSTREDIYTRRTRKLEEAEKRLQHYLDSYSEVEGKPIDHWLIGEEWPEMESERNLRFPTVRSDEFFRLKYWLLKFVNDNDVLAYSALLQVWLVAHEIPWPSGLFPNKLDFSLGGPGRPRKNDGVAIDALGERAEGKRWKEVVGTSEPTRLRYEANRHNLKKLEKRQADRVRKAASRYSPRIDLTLRRLGHLMLRTPLREDYPFGEA